MRKLLIAAVLTASMMLGLAVTALAGGGGPCCAS
jgi:hypothetical protein